MYINFWYPVCTSAALAPATPVPARLFGLPFVAFRDGAGRAHVLAGTCVHRGGCLARGRVVGDHLACPYHGWEFAGDGRCARIPSLGDEAKIPARAKVDSYPVVERYGIVFAFLGDLAEADRPPPGEIPEWDQPGWRASGPVVFDVDAYFERSMENGLDPAHNEFVHTLQGNIRFQPEHLRVGDDTWGSTLYVRMEPPKPGTTKLEHLRKDAEAEHFGASSGHHGPNVLVTRINLSRTNSFVQYFFEQPLDEDHTRIYFVNLRNCMLDEASDRRITDINMAIADEDIAVISHLDPVRTPESSTKELLVSGDECVSAYRRHLADWESRGWRIDQARLRAGRGDVAYAVPSPGRRESGNWVLDPVPLVGDRAAAQSA